MLHKECAAMFAVFFIWQIIRKYSFFWALVLGIGGCGFLDPGSSGPGNEGNLSNRVLILIAPRGVRPLVFEDGKDGAICRRGHPASEYGLEPAETSQTDPVTAGDLNNADGANDEATIGAGGEQKVSRIFTDVARGWFKIGLHIGNLTDYFLVIDDLKFRMDAPWGTDVRLESDATVGSGYCDSDPLYLIPPGKSVSYNPDRLNYTGNLQIYVDGISLPEEAPTSPGEQEQSGQGISEAQQQLQASERLFIRTYLPSYKVQLIVTGHFMDEQRNYVANFSKEISFSTSSRY